MTWDDAPTANEGFVLYYLGAPEDPDLNGQRTKGVPISWQNPPESVKDGCPYGTGMGAFVATVLRYARRRVGDGSRVSNRLYDTCDDPLIIEAVHYLEFEQERNAAAFSHAQAEHKSK